MRKATLAAALLTALASAHAATVFEAEWLRVELGADGTLTRLFDKASGTERLRTPTPFCQVVVDGKRYGATGLKAQEDRLRFTFDVDGVAVTLRVATKLRYLVFAIDAVEGKPTEVAFAQVRTKGATRSSWGGILYFAESCIGLVEGAPEARLTYGSGKGGSLGATAYADLGIKGQQAALYGCPRDKIREVVGEIEKAFNIPLGIGLKTNDANKRSYLMAYGVNHRNVDRLIEHAKAGGFGTVMFIHGTWAHFGHKYAVPESRWPGGVAQLKAAVDKIHAAGMLAAAHMFATKIPKRSDYMTPVPDKRLYKDRFIALGADVDAKADFLPTAKPPTGWPRLPGTRDLHVDDEVLTYSELSLAPPYGFKGCKRGAYGTTPAPHKANATVAHIVTDESRGIFVIDQKTDMLDEVAANIASTYEAAGFDWPYFDGAEDVPPPRWFTTSMGQLALIRKLKRKPVAVQVAASGTFSWHLVSRVGQRDYYWQSMDPKDEIDDAITRSVRRARNCLMAAEIGWFPLRTRGRRLGGTTIDQVEYLYAKALSVDAAVSMQASAERFDRLHHRGPILHIMKQLEDLRVKGYFPEAVKKRVRTPHADFMLARDKAGRYHLQRAREIPFVARTSLDVRAFRLEKLDGVPIVTLWNTGPRMWMQLDTPADTIGLTDYLGKPVAVESLPGGRCRFLVATRLYMNCAKMWRPRMTFRRARVTPVPPAMVCAQAEAGKLAGQFTLGSKTEVAYPKAIGDYVVPAAHFARDKASQSHTEFTLDVPHDGTWYLWARVRYLDTNSNSFFLTHIGGPIERLKFGNTLEAYNHWFWEGGIALRLKKGPCTIRLEGREGKRHTSPALDAICLVDEAGHVPTDAAVRKALAK